MTSKNVARHPIQPLELDGENVVRFKANEIVRYILNNGGIDLNQIASQDFSREDQEQFAQLIGYSLSGAGELSYFSDEVWNAAQRMYENGETETEARIRFLEEELLSLKDSLREPIALLYRIHPDDLKR